VSLADESWLSLASLFLTVTQPTQISTLSLHDALPIWVRDHNEDDFFIHPVAGVAAVADGMGGHEAGEVASALAVNTLRMALVEEDRKSTRLNSSHVKISYAVFCLKKKK